MKAAAQPCASRLPLTTPEQHFWQAVRGKQGGTRFRQLHGIGHYIVDFIALSGNW
ncbi:DUF559 domain-containing protein [Oceanobacter sp. 5_MG-2023]|uniref:DUF559 domain-containing protein n=1 Tax=Oceanobacter sp. 5_MG-2023 TaxID=3062645 RepID=UPI0034C5D1E5